MSKKDSSTNQLSTSHSSKISAQRRLHQRGPEIQRYGTVNQIPPWDFPEEPVRLESTESLNQLLADTSTLRVISIKNHTGRFRDQLFISFICSSISIFPSRFNWLIPLLSAFNSSVA